MIKNKRRRAEPKIIGRNRKSGFTMVETLVTVSIIVILLAIGTVGILRYRNYLRITELDNMARSIYMAAQNRAVLLDNDRRFQTVLKGASGGAGGGTKIALAGSGKERWYIDSKTTAAAALDDLLPTGTIDPALRNGRFYIVYEAESASVTDVFYVEQDYDLNTYTGGIAGALGELGADDKRDKRMEHKPMIGWFGGNAGAPRGEYLEEPTVKVLITNKEELTLQVTFEMPAGVSDVDRVPSVTLLYGPKPVDLLTGAGGGRLVKKNDADITVHSVQEATYTWVLDSLVPKSEDARRGRFKELFDDIPPLGGEFTVRAGLTLTASDGGTSSFYATGTDNSLFAGVKEVTVTAADGSAATARSADIKYLRHLQNLDMPSSWVTPEISMAEQTQNIEAGKLLDNAGAEIKDSYEFTPIENGKLSSYSAANQEAPAAAPDPGPCVIENLKVTPASTGTGTDARNAAGLFSEAKGADETKTFQFQNVRLVNPQIEGEDKNAGALVGSAENVSFENCQVTKASIKGSNAGALAGGAKNAVFTDCLAGKDEGEKNAIDGKNNAGGMVGTADGSLAFEDCQVVNTDVKGTAAGSTAGGMAGNATGGCIFKGCQVSGTQVTGTGDGSIAGGLAGSTRGVTVEPHIAADGNNRKCTVEKITVDAKKYAGGMAGYNEGSPASFKNCEALSTTVTSTDGIAGGIAGGDKGNTAASFVDCGIKDLMVTSTSNSAGGMLGCKSLGSVTFTGCTVGKDENGEEGSIAIGGGSNAGGLLGCTKGAADEDGADAADAAAATFTDCTVGKAGGSSAITVTAARCAGGLSGDSAGSLFNICTVYNTTVSGTGSEGRAGGLAGNVAGECVFKGCQVSGAQVSGTGDESAAGGLAGSTRGVTFELHIAADGSKRKCTVEKITVDAKKYAGGMAGYNEGSPASFKNCEALSTMVTSTDGIAGGIAGGDKGDIAANFVDCGIEGLTVTSTSNSAGGMLGWKSQGSATFIRCTVGKDGAEPITITGGRDAGGILGCTDYQAKEVDEGESKREDKDCNATAAFTACFVGKETADDGTISTIAVTAAKNAGGLAGVSAGGSFSGCQVVNAQVTSAGGTMTSDSGAGGLAGYTADTSFSDCIVGEGGNVTISALYLAGGAAGCLRGGSFEGCQVVNARVTGLNEGSYAGGLAGNTNNVTFCNYVTAEKEVRHCTARNVTVQAVYIAGGVTGNNEGDASFEGCEVAGAGAAVTCTGSWSYAGGVSGFNWGGTVSFKSCEVESLTVRATAHVGGLMGCKSVGSVTFDGCKVKENVTITGGNNVGGLLGLTDGAACKAMFMHCTVGENGGSVTIQGKVTAGGLVGNTEGSTEGSNPVYYGDCHVKNISVEAPEYVGGLAGKTRGDIFGKYKDKDEDGKEVEVEAGCSVENASVNVTGYGRYVGGLTGFADGGGSFSGCRVTGGTVTADYDSHIGGLTGRAMNIDKFSNCHVKNTIIEGKSPDTWVPSTAGGLAGSTEGSIFEECSASWDLGTQNTVTATAYAGGLTGNAVGGSFSGCRVTGAVVVTTGMKLKDNDPLTSVTGGLAGHMESVSTLSNCKAINTKVSAVSYAGGLLGEIKNTDLSGCGVYWDNTTGLKGDKDYQVTAKFSGGLVGMITDDGKIQQSFAATIVEGEECAGGLVGGLSVPRADNIPVDKGGNKNPDYRSTVVIEKSYADCYLKAGKGAPDSTPYAGGLVGSKEVEVNLTLTNVYAAGFITMDGKTRTAAGLCSGYAFTKEDKSDLNAAKAINSYAAMHYDDTVERNLLEPLANEVAANNCYYLNYSGNTGGQTYLQMRNINIGDAFQKGVETHYYRLSVDASTEGTYPFPGLAGLPHYGDWVTQSQAGTSIALDALSVSGNDLEAVSGGDVQLKVPTVSDSNAPAVSGNDVPDETLDEEAAQVDEEAPGEKEDPGTGRPADQNKPADAVLPENNNMITGGDDGEPADQDNDNDNTGGEGSEAASSSQDEAGAVAGGGDTS